MSNIAAATVATTATTRIPSPRALTYACQVVGVSAVTAETFQVELESPIGTTLDYYAGQYLQLEYDISGDGQGQLLSYSIANDFNPQYPRRLQLFIQQREGLADRIVKYLSQLSDSAATIPVTLPMGRAFLQTDLGLPHLLVAAGSGISQVKCLTEAILSQHPSTVMHIYWSNRRVDDFYLLDDFQGWAAENKNLHFTPILESADVKWEGRSGYIYQVIRRDFEHLEGVQAYLCGSPQMVYGTIDKLASIGLTEKNCYSDVFDYAPRA